MAALIFCAALIAYLPALKGGFVWDDVSHVTRPELRSLHGLWRIWFDLGATQQYYPFLHSAFWMEHRLWGDAVLGYHLTNILLHACSACLVVMIVRRLSLPGAWLAGFIFALHPVCVEAVAWISEQKSTLSTLFYLSSVLVYLNFDRTRRRSQYYLALALFVLALLSKSVTATLPAALLVIFWWQRGRLDWKRDVLPLTPWLALGAGVGLFTAYVERTYIGAQGTAFTLSFLDRCLLAGRVIWFYFGKLLWPADLIFNYPHWKIDASEWWPYLFPLGVLAVAAGLWMVARKNRGPLAAFLLFIGTLFPALGFLNVYPFVYSYVADHFQYLASLGIIVPAAALLTVATERIPDRRFVPALAGLLLVALGTLTWRQSEVYKDVETLYRATLLRNPGSLLVQNNLGTHLLTVTGGLPEAISHFEAALAIDSESAEAHNNLGSAFAKVPGRVPDAIAQFEAAIRIRPNFPEAHNNLANTLLKVPGRAPEALEHLKTAIQVNPSFADAHNNLGTVLRDMPGRLSDAIVEFETALRIDPDLAEAHNNLGNALSSIPDRVPEAISQFEAALRLKPDSAEAHSNLGSMLTNQPGRLPDAISQFEAALRINPDSAEAHNGLGIALSRIPERAQEAIPQFEAALRLKPDFGEAHNNLGGVLANMPGRMPEAIAQFQAAIRNTPDLAEAHMNLGGALVDIPGRMPEALAQFETALRIKPDFAQAHNILGVALSRVPGRSSDAIAHFQAALRIKPDYADAQAGLGLVLANIPGRMPEALQHLETALKLQPDPDVQQLVNRLRAGQR